jgi:protein-S-isoprenylcysteine O-methyltransferase Ste14
MVSQRRNIAISALFTIFGGPGIILVLLPFWITRFRIPAGEPRWQLLLFGAGMSVGLAPVLESIARFVLVGRGTLFPTTPPEHLVVSGFYRYVRNPMYVGVLTALAGEAILFMSRGLVIEEILVWLGFDLFIRLHEEPFLSRRYPSEFPKYKRSVPRWVPRLTPWDGSQI